MKEEQVVVVFPSLFSLNKIDSLLSNLKKILKIRHQKFGRIQKDDSVIVIHANDSVATSSTINSLFGIEKVAIAKKIDNKFNLIVSTITKIGSSLLLRSEKFYVKVEGHSSTYLPKDIELAATSSLIEKTTDLKVKPGTEENHDKLLYTYLTKSSAYVCIFVDKGSGGIPYNCQKEQIVCCVYDEFSAISCLQTIKMGFDVKVLVCYRNEEGLLKAVKMISRILLTVVLTKVKLEFFKLSIRGNSSASHIALVKVITEILSYVAKSNKIRRISLAISPLIHPAWFIEDSIKSLTQKNLIPWFPLSGIDKSILDTAREIGLEKYISEIEDVCKLNFGKRTISKDQTLNMCKVAIKTRKSVTVIVGPKSIHDILDSLKTNH